MSEDTETFVFKLINAGSSLIVIGIIAIVFLVPFFASPAAFKYRDDPTIWQDMEKLGPTESGIEFCHEYSLALWLGTGGTVFLGLFLAFLGRSLSEPNAFEIEESALEEPESAPEQEELRKSIELTLSGPRRLAPFYLVLAALGFAAISLGLRAGSFVICATTLFFGMFFLYKSIHVATLRTVFSVRGRELTVVEKDILVKRRKTFADVRGIDLGKSVRGEGVVAFSADSVRKAIELDGNAPKIVGLVIQGTDDSIKVPVNLPLEQLAELADRLMVHIHD